MDKQWQQDPPRSSALANLIGLGVLAGVAYGLSRLFVPVIDWYEEVTWEEDITPTPEPIKSAAPMKTPPQTTTNIPYNWGGIIPLEIKFDQ